MTEENISWDEATATAGFVELKVDTEKKVTITNWKFERRAPDAKVAPGEIEFLAEVVEEDGEPVEEKIFSTTSKRLKAKLRPILENKEPNQKVTVSILRIGESFQTQYSCREIVE